MNSSRYIIHGICEVLSRPCLGAVLISVMVSALSASAEVRDFSIEESVNFEVAFKTMVERISDDSSGGDREAGSVESYSPYLIRVLSPTGYVAEVNGLMPTGTVYSAEEVTVALAQCISNRVSVYRRVPVSGIVRPDDFTEDMITGNMMLHFKILPQSSAAARRLSPLLFDSEVADYHSAIATTMGYVLDVSDESTRFVYICSTNALISTDGMMPVYVDKLLSLYTNGCDSVMSGVVQNAVMTFTSPECSARHFTKWHDLLYLATVPGYERSRMRYDLVTNQVDTVYWRRYFRLIKDELDALQESDFTTPVFSGTPQR